MDLIKVALASPSPQAVQAMAGLRHICDALGPERTRTELLPYLTEEIVRGNVNDEALFAIAVALGRLPPRCAGDASLAGPALLAPLRELMCVEDAATREAAVTSVRALGDELPAAALAPHLTPLVLELGTHTDWHTPRVAACGVLPLAYRACAVLEAKALLGEAAEAEATSAPAAPSELLPTLIHGGTGTLLTLFSRCAADESPRVRKAAAAELGELARAMIQSLGEGRPATQATVAAALGPALGALLQDDSELVRVAAIGASGPVLRCLELDAADGVAHGVAHSGGPANSARDQLLSAARDKERAHTAR